MDQTMLTVMGLLYMGVVVLCAGLVYLLPTLIAWGRHHHQSVAIAVLNILLGWTVAGWVGSLVWSLTNPPPSQANR
jgi:hypothetical protein